jgi:oligopeptidase B
MRRHFHLGLTFLSLFALVALVQAQPGGPRPPVAKKVAKLTELHGDTLVDNYYWLRQKQDPEVIKYLETENAYTDQVMKPTVPLQEKLYKEFLDRIQQTDLSVPVRIDNYWYYSRTQEGKQYPVHCRKQGSLDGKEQIILDVNELAREHKFFNVGAHVVSDDGNLLAFSSDITGFRDYTLHVKDLRTGQMLPDKLTKVGAVVWAADNLTLFYVTEDHAKRPYRLWRHKLGDAQDKDSLLHEEKDELFRVGVAHSKDRKYVFLNIGSFTSSEVHYLKRDQPEARFAVLLAREADHRYNVEHRNGEFYIRTNKAAKNFRLVTAPVATPGPKHWQELIAHRPEVLLDNVGVFAGHLVLSERESGLERLVIFDPASKKRTLVTFDEPTYALSGSANPEFDTTQFRFAYTSFTTPQSVFEYDVAKGTRRLLKATQVLGGYDPKVYQTERVWATASDGVKVPISVVYKKGVKLDGLAPLLLYGYGAYGASTFATFNEPRLSLLDRGVIYAIAHIRGGGEMGEPWHDGGKMMNKRNSFTDFIACAEHLIAAKYTSKDRLAIQGGSAGGLLMGGVLAMRPDLPRVAVLEVPFVDVINTMLDETLPLTVPEFLEWGNPRNLEHYNYMKSYCPYTNLKPGYFPAMLVRTSLHDSQVMYWEPAKYVAKLRPLKKDDNVLLFKCNMNAGHGGASGRYDALRERAFVFAFVLTQLGVEKDDTTK